MSVRILAGLSSKRRLLKVTKDAWLLKVYKVPRNTLLISTPLLLPIQGWLLKTTNGRRWSTNPVIFPMGIKHPQNAPSKSVSVFCEQRVAPFTCCVPPQHPPTCWVPPTPPDTPLTFCIPPDTLITCGPSSPYYLHEGSTSWNLLAGNN